MDKNTMEYRHIESIFTREAIQAFRRAPYGPEKEKIRQQILDARIHLRNAWKALGHPSPELGFKDNE